MTDNLQTLKELSVKVNELAQSYRYREALQLSDRLLEDGGPNKEHLFFRSIWLHKVGRNSDALAALNQSIELGFNEFTSKVLMAKLLLINKKFEQCVIYCDENFRNAPNIFGKLKTDALKESGDLKLALEWVMFLIQREDCQTVDIVDLFLKLAVLPINGLDLINPVAAKLSKKFSMFNAWGNELLWYPSAHKNSLLKVIDKEDIAAFAPKVINALYLLGDDEFGEVWRWHELAADALMPENKNSEVVLPTKDKVRIGFVSSDFRNHSVAYFLKPLFENIDRKEFEVFCYYVNENVDETTYFFEKHADKFWFAGTMSNDALASTIVNDKVDVLIDLNGHTGKHRLEVFGARCAPVQVSWLGYPSTTAVKNIDYRIVDCDTDPKDTKEIYSEELIRLNRLFLAFQPVENVPIELKENKNQITFGCFNALNKINEELLTLWASLLNEVEDSNLIFKSKGLESLMIRARVIKLFSDRGVDKSRIIFLDRDKKQVNHLKQYNKIDISLDTFPYGGTTTTCESLYMGVPVATIVGDSHRSRVSYSILKSMGLERFSSRKEEFVKTIKELCRNKEDLYLIKKGLRDNFLSSPISDGKGFAEAWFNKVYELHVKKQNEAKQA